MWDVTLTEVIKRFGNAQLGDAVDFDLLAVKLNQSNARHSGTLRNFEQTYSAEARGIVDLCAAVTLDVVEAMAHKRGIRVEDKNERDRLEALTQFKNLLAIALERDQARDILRTMHIQACLYASVRWNKRRKLKGNDLLAGQSRDESPLCGSQMISTQMLVRLLEKRTWRSADSHGLNRRAPRGVAVRPGHCKSGGGASRSQTLAFVIVLAAC